MKACDVKIGQLVKTQWGYATVMKFFAPAHIGCIIVTPFFPKSKRWETGSWIYLRGLDLDETEVISECG